MGAGKSLNGREKGFDCYGSRRGSMIPARAVWAKTRESLDVVDVSFGS